MDKVLGGDHKKLDSQKVCFLDRVFMGEEVRDAVFDMSLMKAPGKTVYQPCFFRNSGELLGMLLLRLV